MLKGLNFNLTCIGSVSIYHGKTENNGFNSNVGHYGQFLLSLHVYADMGIQCTNLSECSTQLSELKSMDSTPIAVLFILYSHHSIPPPPLGVNTSLVVRAEITVKLHQE